MDEVISNFEDKINKLDNDFKLIKPFLEKELNKNDYNFILDELLKLKNNLNNSIDSLVNIKSVLFKNNLEILDLNQKREIQENLIQEKINSIIKPLMLGLLLKYSE